MSKINEIHQKLGELNGGEFQKLMDVYFSKAIKGTLYPIGSVLDNNNTKTGTPDTLIKLNNNNYIYIEYTVKKVGIVKKFKEDISKCLDESKTGIQSKFIEKIICCCNSRLDTKEIEELVSYGRENEIVIEVISLDSIAFKLINEALIIKDFFGISIDTQQILEIEDFINFNDSAKLATPLSIELLGREIKLAEIVDSLETSQIVVLSGLPGVGKTRLALEILKLFKENQKQFTIKCLRSNGQNIYDDLNVYFSNPGSYLILIDDANLLTNLHLILDLFSRKSSGVEIKLVITVREYAEEKVLNLISKYEFKLFKIDPLNREIIKLLCNRFEINNQKYIDRIYEISKGNPRLAIMACSIAKKENKFSSLTNVVDIIESYYKEIKSDFEIELENKDLLKIGAVICFLNHISLKDENNINIICRITEIDKSSVLENIEKLHSMEIVDIYENEIVKISDQILSIYIFYLTIFKERILTYKSLLDNYYPELKGRIVDNLNNVLSYFYKNEHLSYIKEIVKNKYNENLEVYSEKEQEEFLLTFWFALDIEGLIYVRDKIEKLIQGETTTFVIRQNDEKYSDFLGILAHYKHTKYYKEAIELILVYLEKQPQHYSAIYQLLIDRYGFNKDSQYFGYIHELELFNLVENKYNIQKNELYSNLLFELCKYYLKFSYEYTLANQRGVTIYKIPIYLNEDSVEIRMKAWSFIFDMYNKGLLKRKIHEFLYKYGREYSEFEIEDILKVDKDILESNLVEINITDLEEIIIFNHLSNLFNQNGLEFKEELRGKFNSEQYQIYLTHFSDPVFKDEDLKEEEELKVIAENLKLAQFSEILNVLRVVSSIDYLKSKAYSAARKIEFILINTPMDNRITLLEMFFNSNIEISIHPAEIVKSLDRIPLLERLEEVILSYEFFNKHFWLYCIYRELSEFKTDEELLVKIYEHFEQPEKNVVGYMKDITFLSKFVNIDEFVLVRVINLILEQDDITVIRALVNFLSKDTVQQEYILKYLQDDWGILKNLYFRLSKVKQYFDYDSEILQLLVIQKSEFLNEIIESILSDDTTTFNFKDDIKLDFVWCEDNWEELTEIVSDIVVKYIVLPRKNGVATDLLERIIIISNKTFEERLLNWIDMKIVQWANDEILIKALFEILSKFEVEKKVRWIAMFIKENPKIEDFKKIPLLPSVGDFGSGSEVPRLRERQEFYQKINDSISGIQYLEHKQYLVRRIEYLEKYIRDVKIRELIEDI